MYEIFLSIKVEAGVLVQCVKSPLEMPAFHIEYLVQFLSALLPIQLPANVFIRQQKMTEVLESMSPT